MTHLKTYGCERSWNWIRLPHLKLMDCWRAAGEQYDREYSLKGVFEGIKSEIKINSISSIAIDEN